MERKTFTAYDTMFTNLKKFMPSVDVAKLMSDFVRLQQGKLCLSIFQMPHLVAVFFTMCKLSW